MVVHEKAYHCRPPTVASSTSSFSRLFVYVANLLTSSSPFHYHTNREEAINEIRLLASFVHPNIIRYCDAFLSDKYICIILEYARRGDLGRRIRKLQERKRTGDGSSQVSKFIRCLEDKAMLPQTGFLDQVRQVETVDQEMWNRSFPENFRERMSAD